MKNYAKAIIISFLIYPTISLADSSGIGVTLPGNEF